MDDLMKCLYEFMLDRRMKRIWRDEEFRACSLRAEEQEERMKSCLNEEQRKELSTLIDRLTEQDSIEKEHIFRAALDLARELNALAGA